MEAVPARDALDIHIPHIAGVAGLICRVAGFKDAILRLAVDVWRVDDVIVERGSGDDAAGRQYPDGHAPCCELD